MTDSTNYPIIYIEYQDHHWFDEDILKSQLDEMDTGVNQGLVEEVGFLVKRHRDYFIICQSVQRPIDPLNDDGYTRFIKPTKILRKHITKIKYHT